MSYKPDRKRALLVSWQTSMALLAMNAPRRSGIKSQRILKISDRLLSTYCEAKITLECRDLCATEKSVVVRLRLRTRNERFGVSVIAKHILSYPTERLPNGARFIDEC